MVNIAEQLQSAYARIRNASQKVGRAADSVQLLAVSKTKPHTDILVAYDAGHRAFAENYAQELAEKAQVLNQYPDIQWHFIGPLQTNKAKLVANNASWVHSIEKLKTAERLSQLRDPQLPALNLLVQVNISAEASKSGVALADVEALGVAFKALPNVVWRGLMAIPSASADDATLAAQYHALAQLLAQLKSRHPQLDTLSMGMSDDVEIAIAQGATMVRLGTAIFGQRNYKP